MLQINVPTSLYIFNGTRWLAVGKLTTPGFGSLVIACRTVCPVVPGWNTASPHPTTADF
jgi:hypothetical protein